MAYTEFFHYGTPCHSGRYPCGSGGDTFLGVVERLHSEGLSEVDIAKAFDMSTGELRNQKTLAKMLLKEERRIFATRQRDAGMSVSAIAKEMNLPSGTVSDLLKPGANAKFRIIKTVADALKKAIDKFGFVDVGEGVEIFLGVSSLKLDNAVTLLKNEGYVMHYIKVPQLGTNRETRMKILGPPGSTYKELMANRHKISIPNSFSEDGGRSFLTPGEYRTIDAKRVLVVYNNEGGGDKDGLIELRRGVPELSLGEKRYAQVRIAVNDTHYLKGMAIHKDTIPDGYDAIFYTSKDPTGNKLDALKPLETDNVLPFGAVVKKPRYYESNGEKLQSAVNIVNEEGDWQQWSRNLSSQFLSKQSTTLAKQQLDLRFDARQSEYDEIMGLTNPVVKKHLLGAFGDTLDSDSIFLKAAALPRQSTAVLLPDPTMKPNEVYAPGFKNGEAVSLVRHPHGGIFEIPTLRVNNRAPNAKSMIGNRTDAIAIHPDVAKRLSGADFDGDSVVVFPNKGNIRTAPALDGLKNFDPRRMYPPVKGMKVLTKEGKGLKMGGVSNLITDMTLQGASDAELARAIRHSMVVIDAEKHKLNYEQSYKDNGIAALKRKYQGSARSGASTLISKAKSQKYVPHRKDHYTIDPDTGAKIWTYTGKSYIDPKTGKEYFSRTKSNKMYEEPDAFALSSGTKMEAVYATHANKLKALADRSRLSYIQTKGYKRDSNAAATYAPEVASLQKKLTAAMRNQPLERKAQIIGNEIIRQKKVNNPGVKLKYKVLQSERSKALAVGRSKAGAHKPIIRISEREWEAIQMGAISKTKLEKILRNADMDQIKAYATPRTDHPLGGRESRARMLLDAGYSVSEVADAIGASPYQISNLNMDQ